MCNIIGGAFTLASLMLAGHALAERWCCSLRPVKLSTLREVTSDTADQDSPHRVKSVDAFSGVGSSGVATEVQY